MSLVCEFGFSLRGPKARLDKVKAALATSVEENPGGYEAFALKIDQLCPIGLSDCGGNGPINGPTEETGGTYRLSFCGATTNGPPLEFVARLSATYPDLEVRVSATTDHELNEYWVAKNGEPTPVDIYAQWRQANLRMIFVCDGRELNPPRFEGDMLCGNGQPLQLTADELVDYCERTWHFFFADAECPGKANGKLRIAAEEFVNAHCEYTGPPSPAVMDLAADIAARQAKINFNVGCRAATASKCELCGKPIRYEQPPSGVSGTWCYDSYRDRMCNECWELCWEHNLSFGEVEELRRTGMCLEAIEAILWERWEHNMERQDFSYFVADQQIEANEQAGFDDEIAACEKGLAADIAARQANIDFNAGCHAAVARATESEEEND